MIATSGFLTAVECTKSVFGRGSAPDPAGGAHDAPPDPLVGWGGDTPSPFPTPSTPSASRSRRLRRLVLGAFGASFPKPPPKFFMDTALFPFIVLHGTTTYMCVHLWCMCVLYYSTIVLSGLLG